MNVKRNPTRSPHHRAGLTLFEVLLSLAIFLGALAAIGQLVANGVRGSVQTRLETAAILKCETKLAEVLAGAQPMETANNISFPDDPGWTWSLEITPVENSDLLHLQVTVAHAAGSNLGKVVFTLNRLQRMPPPILDTPEEEQTGAGET